MEEFIMKKNLMLIMVWLLVASLLAGCMGTIVVVERPAEETQPVLEEGALKTGLAVITNASKSTSVSAEAEGAAEYDVTLAAVLVDDEGVIYAARLDAIGTTVNFDATGVITTDLASEVQTKNEKGENYGMVAWGGAIAEWDAQAAALCEYAVGKTIEELKNGAVDETGYAPDGSDLASSATVYLGGYVSAIEAAAADAQHLGAQSGDELVLTTINSLGSSANASAEGDGTAQLDVNVAAVSTKDGVITSCVFDAVQAKVTFNVTGTITADLTAPIQTKNELGENYGMVAWGGAIAEWNEQAASFAEYITGKTAADVAGIAVAEGKPTDADLTSSVTIKIGGFQGLIAKVLGTSTEAGALKTGLAVITDISKSASVSEEAEGSAEYDVTLAAVLVDDEGIIRAARLDAIGATVNFDSTGVITTDLTAEVQTKNEKGENYGMVAWGGAIAEWDAQAAALCEYAVGKTIDELKNGAVDETGYAPDGSDLSTSATIYLAGYVSAIEAAVNNAQHLGAQSGDELVLTTVNALDSSANASAEGDGTAQLDVNVAAVSTKDGVITSCIFDAVQAKVSFDAAGNVTADLTAPVQTKNELGEGYGMVAWGGAIAEWNEQAASFAEYVTGKTAEDVSGIAVEEGKPTDADLTSSVTIKIGGFQGLIAKALA